MKTSSLHRLVILSITLVMVAFSTLSHSSVLYKFQNQYQNLYPTKELACSNAQANGYIAQSAVVFGFNDPWCETDEGPGGLTQYAINPQNGVCPSGYTDDGNGNCVVDNQCTSGSTSTYSHMIRGVNEPITINICGSSSCTQPASIDGCGFTYDLNDVSQCFKNDVGEMWCTVTATGTGSPSSPDNPVYDPSGDSPLPDQPDGCTTSPNGAQVCNSNDDNCGTVNGVDVCMDAPQNCGNVNGSHVCFNDDKNCGNVNGEVVCVQVPPSNSTVYGPQNSAPDGCFSGSGKEVCFNDTVVETTDTSTVSNQDGSMTSTTVTTNNIINGGSTTTTTTTNIDNSTSTVVTSQGNGGQIPSGGDSGSSEEGGNGDVVAAIEQQTTDIIGQQSDYDTTATTTASDLELSTARQALLDDLEGSGTDNYGFIDTGEFSVSHWINNYFNFTFGACSGGIHTVFLGKSFDLEPCDKLAPLREVLAWVFYIITAMVIFSITFRRLI